MLRPSLQNNIIQSAFPELCYGNSELGNWKCIVKAGLGKWCEHGAIELNLGRPVFVISEGQVPVGINERRKSRRGAARFWTRSNEGTVQSSEEVAAVSLRNCSFCSGLRISELILIAFKICSEAHSPEYPVLCSNHGLDTQSNHFVSLIGGRSRQWCARAQSVLTCDEVNLDVLPVDACV